MATHTCFLVTYLIFPSFVFYNLCSTKSFILHLISSVKINYISFRLIFYRHYFTTIHVDESSQFHLAMQTMDQRCKLPQIICSDHGIGNYYGSRMASTRTHGPQTSRCMPNPFYGLRTSRNWMATVTDH